MILWQVEHVSTWLLAATSQ